MSFYDETLQLIQPTMMASSWPQAPPFQASKPMYTLSLSKGAQGKSVFVQAPNPTTITQDYVAILAA